MKREILVELDEDRVSVNKDTPTKYVINPLLLEEYNKNNFDPDHLKALGKSIYDNIFSTPQRRSLIENKGPDDLIIRIKSDIPKVHDIPFELLNRGPKKEEFCYLLKDPTINLLREPGNDIYWELPKRPLKMLLILAQPLEIMKEAPIDPLREVEEIKEALGELLEDGLIELFIEERSSLRRLFERLKSQSFDIVHYSGHGVKGGYLILEDSKDPQRAAQKSPEDFAEIFRDRPPRLIYLDTCEGARSDTYSPSLAYILSKNLPHCAVVANTAAISDRAATKSVKNFYEKLGSERFEDAISYLRRETPTEWYKTVLFALPGRRFFKKEVIEVPERSPRVEYGLAPPTTRSTYVYRYRLVRKASDLIEDQRALLLHGLGGTGKSTLAQYLCRFFGSYFDHIIFIDLKAEDIEEPEGVFKILEGPECFAIEGSPSNTKERVKKIASHGRLLLVLDNLEEYAQDKDGDLKRKWRIFLDALLDNPKIFTMLTSRFVPYRDQRDRLIGDDATLDIREYEEADIRLLLHHEESKSRERYERLREILPALKKEFGLHPLAISIALSRRYGRDSILKILEDDTLRGLLEYYRPYLSPSPLLRAVCHLPVLLEKEIVEEILSAKEWKLALDLGIAWEEEGFIRFYPILRHFVELDPEARSKMFEKLKDKDGPHAALNCLFLAPKEEKLPYFLKAWSYDVDPAVIKELVDVDDLGEMAHEIMEPGEKALSLNNLGALYWQLGRLVEAEAYYKEALEIYRVLAQKDQALRINLAGTLNNLGLLYRGLGRLVEAEAYYKEALEIYRVLAQKDQAFKPELATVITNLGALYRQLGRLVEAEAYYKEALEIYRVLAQKDQALGINLAATLNNLGVLHRQLGKLVEAEVYLQEALEIRRALAKKNKAFEPDLAMTLNNLGLLYRDLGKLVEAEAYYKEALEIRRALAKKNKALRINLAATLNNLGVLYRQLGRLVEAEAYYKEALEIYRVLAKKNEAFIPYLAMTLNNLGNLHRQLGELVEAEAHLQEALEIRRALAKKNKVFEPDLGTTLNNLGLLYWELKKLVEAEVYLQEALEIRRALAKKNKAFEPDLAMTLNNLGLLYWELGKLIEAEAYLKHTLEIYYALVKKNKAFHPDMATTIENLGNLYWKSGRFVDAETNLKEALEIRRELTQINQDFALFELTALMNYSVFLAGLRKWQELSRHICRYFEIIEWLKKEDVLETKWLRENAPIPTKKELDDMLRLITTPDCEEKTRRLFERILRLSGKTKNQEL